MSIIVLKALVMLKSDSERFRQNQLNEGADKTGSVNDYKEPR